MNDEEERIYMYSDIFSHGLSGEEHSDDTGEREKKKTQKKKKNLKDNNIKNGENEYSKLRAENSTILNNYFDVEPIKSFSPQVVNASLHSDFLQFPQNNEHTLNIFDGELTQHKHSVQLRKPGFYCIYVENSNNSKWDSIYFGLSKMQVEVNYKLIPQNEENATQGKAQERNKEAFRGKPQRKKSPSANQKEEEGDLSDDVPDDDNDDDHQDDDVEKEGEESDVDVEEEKGEKREPMTMEKENLNDEISRICNFNFDQTDILFQDSKEIKNTKHMNNIKGRNKNCYNNLRVKNKKKESALFEENKTNTESFSCTFHNENQIRVSSKKKKYVYLYNNSANSMLHLNVSTCMSLGMTIECRYGLLYCGKYNQIPQDPYTPFRKRVSILSLDGGGILAMSTLIVLNRIENEIRKVIGNDDVKLIDCFDMVCGTSAGGLISLALLKQMGLRDVTNLLPSTMQKIFVGNRNIISGILFEGYDINNVKDLFMEKLGTMIMSSYKKVYCFVTATDVKHNPYKLFLLRNYTHKYNAINGESYEGINKFPLWLAAWATASAPTYLKGPSSEDMKDLGFHIKPEIHLVDGALKASNPALIALEECARLNNKNLSSFIKEDLDTIVSIGTGKSPTKLTQSAASGKSASTFEIIINSAHLLTRANETHREVLQWLSDRENTYFRFNVPNIGDINIDSQDVRDFDIIAKATRDYLFDEKFYEIKRLAHKLANNYMRSRYL
ncbi:phospholipase, putative [Plasmodium knowlesi strain H]|uniref:Phospholipase, putative n=3 Tax=Plasmodium knowlesi TaxID=5850 RepID=A0A5K1UWW6_PLAKH|nr:patatin-like phospholipase 1, putative [Plasmodium knowlesi strain H]OTN66712.1 putative Phospholipase [Plasmodium knowlesi]CAA9986760.1 patatin-like phospholipase 1, putative [Plasmodium knowlesi strain H]SBO23589.1 phospholipase, putative [Plasmodium knowlesi strain H]SBO25138.1 phospholipase, putative [Plasmodium knowlesi strain H]VVS76234.1 patatin-like phospholipase 1, putative [Plasmodium knowlesi strain H]|eukprot:XP_002257944.1 phospholipase, putative [Plasmodium knowlesi strain H]